MTLKWTPARHPQEDVFEDYVFERLDEARAGEFEEHLLVCEECQSELQHTDEYIRLLKAATAAFVPDRIPIALPVQSRNPGLRGHAAAAILLLTFSTALLSWRLPLGDPKSIPLEAYRGGSSTPISRAPARHPLDLKIDLTDVRSAAGYRVDIVDAKGTKVWSGGIPARVAKGLAPGIYWVRLSTDSGEPLREFGLAVDQKADLQGSK